MKFVGQGNLNRIRVCAGGNTFSPIKLINNNLICIHQMDNALMGIIQRLLFLASLNKLWDNSGATIFSFD